MAADKVNIDGKIPAGDITPCEPEVSFGDVGVYHIRLGMWDEREVVVKELKPGLEGEKKKIAVQKLMIEKDKLKGLKHDNV